MSSTVPGGGLAGASPAKASDPAFTGGEGPSIGELLGAVTADLSTLMHQELELAKAEAKHSASQAGKGAGMFAGAGVAANLMLTFLSLAAAWLIGHWLGSLGWGALVVALVWGVVAAVLAKRGQQEFTKVGMPQTAQTTAQIPNALKGNE